MLWAQLAERHGLQIFRAALTEHLMSSKFFPSPGDLDEQCKSLAARQRHEAAETARQRRNDEELKYWRLQEIERREHPERFVSVATVFEAVLKMRQKSSQGGG
jgi:hypothetical protein